MPAYTFTPVHTVRLTTTTTAYATVPAGKVWIVRSVVVTNASTASASRVRLFFWGTGGGDRTLDDLVPVTTSRTYDFRVRLDAGDVIRANSSVVDTINLTLSVYEFST